MALKFGSQVDLLKIPVLGLVPESSITASPPASPTNGQLWYDTTVNRLKVYENGSWVLSSLTGAELQANKNAASGYAGLDGSTKLAIGQVPTGTTGTTVPFGNDSRFTDSRAPNGSATGDLTGSYPAPTIAALAVTDAKVAAANKDGAAGTASMRTLGSGSTQALAGNTPLNSIATATAAVALGGFKITGLGAPVATDDAARLVDVQNAQSGIDLKPSVRVASTADLAVASAVINGAVVDGVTLATGDRILLKNQATASQNGSYTVAASGAASRTTDVVTANALWLVEEGTTQADTSWMVTTNGAITLGSTALTFAQFGAGSTTYTGTTNRISVAGTVIDIASAYVGQSTVTTLGTITTGTWNGTSIAVANGGTGTTTASGARTNLGATGKYTATLAALVAGTPLTITHSLGSQDVIASFRNASDDSVVHLSWVAFDANSVKVTADVAYSTSAVKVVIIG